MFPYCCLLIIASIISCSVFKVHLSCSLNQTVFLNDLSQRTSCRGGFYIRPNQVASSASLPAIQPCSGAYEMRPYSHRRRTVGRLVGQSGLEPPTSRLSVVCSSQLSYWPSSEQTPYPSLRRKRQSSSIPLLLLSKSQPLRWVAILFLENENRSPPYLKECPGLGSTL